MHLFSCGLIVYIFWPAAVYGISCTCFCRFGDSTGGLTVSLLAFPTKWIILIGALLSTIGAGLQTLTGYVNHFLYFIPLKVCAMQCTTVFNRCMHCCDD